MKRLCAAFAACCVSCFAVQLNAQSDNPGNAAAPGAEQTRAATITFADNRSIKLRASEHFRPVALGPGETVTIQLQLPPGLAQTPPVVQALDGGFIDEDALAIAADGTATIRFQAAVAPGLYRLLFNLRGKTAEVEFWVVDPQNPSGNPADLVARDKEVIAR